MSYSEQTEVVNEINSFGSKDGEAEGKPVKSVKTATDLQRFKLEKLLKQPEKPVYIPDRPKERKMPKPPEFIRNTWGSSAGAGSGDFHVYRGVRRREYARQKFLDEQTSKKGKDEEYQQKMEENMKTADERTAKKRAKRLKKQKAKQGKKSRTAKPESGTDTEEEDEETSNEPGKDGNAELGEKLTTNVDTNAECCEAPNSSQQDHSNI